MSRVVRGWRQEHGRLALKPTGSAQIGLMRGNALVLKLLVLVPMLEYAGISVPKHRLYRA